jgi:hypothetical protein
MLARAAATGQGAMLGLISEETRQLQLTKTAGDITLAAGVAKATSGFINLTESIAAAMPDPSKTAALVLRALAQGASVVGDSLELAGRVVQAEGATQSTQAAHIRRRDEWAMQSNQALRELMQIDKQILATKIREQIVRAEAENHLKQLEHSREIDDYLRRKFTATELYEWMDSQLENLHEQAYRLALGQARTAQRLASEEQEFNYQEIGTHWDAARSGLLAGERLISDLKRLEVAYLDRRQHEQNLVRHISLARLDPQALVDFRLNGSCTFKVPEWLLDLVDEGGYMRRIKWVSVSIPCVVGPYASVSSRLSLLSSTVRLSRSVDGGYTPVDKAADARFRVRHGGGEAIVTSSGKDDSGLFETSLRDELKLPFEYHGAESTWSLERPTAAPEFDADTIQDVILHLRFTSRYGGQALKEVARAALPSAGGTERLRRLLSCREDFAPEWAVASATGNDLTIKLDNSVLPYWMVARKLQIKKVLTLTVAARDARAVPAAAEFTEVVGAAAGTVNFGKTAGMQDRLVMLELG